MALKGLGFRVDCDPKKNCLAVGSTEHLRFCSIGECREQG